MLQFYTWNITLYVKIYNNVFNIGTSKLMVKNRILNSNVDVEVEVLYVT